MECEIFSILLRHVSNDLRVLFQFPCGCTFKMLLLSNFKTPTEWLYDNYMILNLVECSYICLSKYSKDDDTSSFSEFVLKIVVVETIIWQKNDRKLTFDGNIKTLCTKCRSKIERTFKDIEHLDQYKKPLYTDQWLNHNSISFL